MILNLNIKNSAGMYGIQAQVVAVCGIESYESYDYTSGAFMKHKSSRVHRVLKSKVVYTIDSSTKIKENNNV